MGLIYLYADSLKVVNGQLGHLVEGDSKETPCCELYGLLPVGGRLWVFYKL